MLASALSGVLYWGVAPEDLSEGVAFRLNPE